MSLWQEYSVFSLYYADGESCILPQVQPRTPLLIQHSSPEVSEERGMVLSVQSLGDGMLAISYLFFFLFHVIDFIIIINIEERERK